MKSFDGKVAVITGAASGIGQACAIDLAQRGCRLAVSDVDPLEDTVAACKAAGAEVHAYRLDVSKRDEWERHVDEVLADFGTVNIVINNAGVAMNAWATESSIEDYEWMMGIDFWGVLYGSQLFLPHLIASGDGHLVNISSLFGIIAVPKQSAYNAAKFAVRGYTEALRQEMEIQGHPVGVTCVHPGGIKTAIARNARMGESESGRDVTKLFDKAALTTPKRAAKTIVSAVRKNKGRVLIGPDAQALELFERGLGGYYMPLMKLGAARVQKDKR